MKKKVYRDISLMLSLLMVGSLFFSFRSFSLAENEVETPRDPVNSIVEEASEENVGSSEVISPPEKNDDDATGEPDEVLPNGAHEDEGEEEPNEEDPTPPSPVEIADDGQAPEENELTDDESLPPLEGDDLEINAVRAGEEEKTFTVTKRPVADPDAPEESVGDFDTFLEAVEACSQNDLGNQYIITMNRDYVIPGDEPPAHRQITNFVLRSKNSNTPYTLKRMDKIGIPRNILDIRGSDCLFTTKNIILDGHSTSQGFTVFDGATLIFDQGTIVQNFNSGRPEVKAKGSAVYVDYGTLIIRDNVTIQNNYSDRNGGAIEVESLGKVDIQGGEFKNNQTTSFGGAVFSWGSVRMTGGTFSENSAEGSGGAIAAYGGEVKILGGQFENNRSDEKGGAIVYKVDNNLLIENAGFIGNRADRGGAVYLQKGSMDIAASEFMNNSASGLGGAIFDESYQYESPVTDPSAYKNIKIDALTYFSGNMSDMGLFNPPSNYLEFTNLAYRDDSDVTHGVLSQRSLLNNYDINYKFDPSFIISFDANGGSGSMNSVWVSKDHDYSLPLCGFTAPENQEFAGWEIDGTTYNVGDSIKVTQDIVVKALWKNVTTESQPEPEPEKPPVEKVVNVTKIWNDNNDREGLRPSSVTFRLFADGEATDHTLVLSAENRWYGEFKDLERYDGDRRIVYTISEDEVEGYVSEVRGNDWSGFTVTNSFVGMSTEPTEPTEPTVPTESSEPTEPTLPPTEPTEPNEEKYIITYDFSGGNLDGDLGPVSFEVDLGETITILDAPLRDGYRFSHWEGSKYYPGDLYVVTGSHTFTAVWEAETHEPTTAPTSTPQPTEPMKPTAPSTTQEAGLPQTGEDVEGTLWIGAIFMLAAGAVVILRRRLKGFNN